MADHPFGMVFDGSVAKNLLIFAFAMGILSTLFWIIQPTYQIPPIPATGGEATLLIEGAKELDGAISMLINLTTGLFVLVALVAKSPLKPNVRVLPGQLALFGIFGLSASGSFYSGLHAKYIVAEDLLARSIDMYLLQNQIASQAWFTVFAGAAAVALVVDALVAGKA